MTDPQLHFAPLQRKGTICALNSIAKRGSSTFLQISGGKMIWWAYALALFLIGAGFCELSARLLQLASALKTFPNPATKGVAHSQIHQTPFVSVHIPTYNEPSKLVIETLKSLALSKYVDFEVIIIDNNTVDNNVWSPVADAAKEIGEHFRFVHIDRLSGAKAGALNVALSLCDARTTHIATVDADYQVDSEFLPDAVRSLISHDVDYVQFPQAYRGVGRAARGVEHELGDYFALFSRGAGGLHSMLPTGTLCLFTLSALKAVGGWPTETITEDAEIGVRLQAAGYKGLWVARNRGRGLLPVDFNGLCKQRARWAAGNLQVLKRLHQHRWSSLRLSDLVNLIVQLTSWISLLAPASMALLLVGVVPNSPLSGFIASLSAATILMSALFTGLRMVISGGVDIGWTVRLEAFAAKTALTWTSALAWIPALSPRPLRFHRTSKAIETAAGTGQPVLAVVSLAFLGVGFSYTLRNQYLEAAASVLLASIWICARAVNANLKHAALLNPELS